MIDIKKLAQQAKSHGEILFKGFVKMLCGSATAVLFATGIYGLCAIASEGGLTAVFGFLGSIALFSIALMATYVLGGTDRKKVVKK